MKPIPLALAFSLTVVAATPAAARADRQELYTVAGIAPVVGRYENPLVNSGQTNRSSFAAEMAVYYGISNSLHFGGIIRASKMTGARFNNVFMELPDKSWSTGTVQADELAFGAGLLGLYRLDTGYPVAPVASAELGFTHHTYSNLAHVPAGQNYGIPFSDKSETRLECRLGLAVEYRFASRFVLSAGAVYGLEPGGLAPWSLSFPVRVGVIW
jgi:hypothetical protein